MPVYSATFKKKGNEYEVVDDTSGKSFASVSAWTGSLRPKAEKRVSLKQFLQEEKAKDQNGDKAVVENGKEEGEGNGTPVKSAEPKAKKSSSPSSKSGSERPKSASSKAGKKPKEHEKDTKSAVVAAKLDGEEPKEKTVSESGDSKSGKPKGAKADKTDSLLERENKVMPALISRSSATKRSDQQGKGQPGTADP